MKILKQNRQERDSEVEEKMVDAHVVKFVVEMDNETKVGQYEYTVLAKTSMVCLAVRYEPRKGALKKAVRIANVYPHFGPVLTSWSSYS